MVKQPYRSQRLVPLLGVGNRGQPTSYGWVAGVNPLAPLSGITNNIMGQKGIRCSLQWAEMTRRCIESQVTRFNSANLKLHF